MSNNADARAQWKTRSGFILAALGAAIGLGNIWRFSYVVGDNGGGAFLVLYFATIALVGLPLLLVELAVGRATQREAASAFRQLGRAAPWRSAGVLGVVVSFVILTYYAVIAGWALKFFAAFASGGYPFAAGEAAAYFRAFTAAAIEPVIWQACIIVATVGIVTGGIERGIERANKILMPALAVIVVGLAIHSLTLPNAGRGLAFLFAPSWEALAQPRVYLAALGQAFFSLGLAMGVLVTYGSYLPQHHRLPIAGVIIAFGDTLFAIVAAIVIFPAVFSFGMSPDQGPGLAFITLPEIFARMAGGQIVGVAFFGLLVLAAITSSVALLEIPVAYAIERWGMSRGSAALAIAAAAFVLGVPSSLGFGPLSQVLLAGLPILDAVDFAASNVILPLSGLAIALFAGWHWRRADALAAIGFRDPRVAQLWRISVRYVAPAMIAIVFLRSLSLI
ncbi:MAG: sodium-dependent transporter [Bradyrhizobiaceae bacterium]|nr:MAG: sodium-dependent transporter [Bradyrhizobiaceae bacterium]